MTICSSYYKPRKLYGFETQVWHRTFQTERIHVPKSLQLHNQWTTHQFAHHIQNILAVTLGLDKIKPEPS